MNRVLSVAFAAPMLLAASVAHAAATTTAFAPPIAFSPIGYLLASIAVLTLIFCMVPRSRGIVSVFLVLVACSIALDVAFAAEAAAPETVAQASSEATKVTWAYGAVVSQWANAAGTLLFAVALYLLRLLPGQISGILLSMRADQVVQKAIDYAINMVKDATKGKALTADVHNEVLAQALQYVLDHAPGWLQSWMGGPDAIAQKIVARLNLAPDAVPDVSAAVAASTPSI